MDSSQIWQIRNNNDLTLGQNWLLKVVVNDYYFDFAYDMILLPWGGGKMTDLRKNIDHYMDVKGKRGFL